MNLSYETRIGILAVIATVVLIFGFKFLKGRNVLDNTKIFYVLYDNVDQLAEAAPVYIRGFQVGTVIDIKLAPDDPTKILVAIDVKKELPIPSDAKAVIFNASLMAGRAIKLEFDRYCSGDDCAQSRTYLEGDVVGMIGSMVSEDEIRGYMHAIGEEVDSLLGSAGNAEDSVQIMTNVQNSIRNLDNITTELNELLTTSQRSLQQTFNNLSSITGNIRSNNEEISEAISNLSTVTEQLSKANLDEFIRNTDETMKSAGSTLRSFDEMAIELKSAVEELDILLQAFNEEDGSLKQLMTDPELFKNISSSARNLDLLLQDFRLHPRRYLNISVFGKNPGDPYVYPDGDPAKK